MIEKKLRLFFVSEDNKYIWHYCCVSKFNFFLSKNLSSLFWVTISWLIYTATYTNIFQLNFLVLPFYVFHCTMDISSFSDRGEHSLPGQMITPSDIVLRDHIVERYAVPYSSVNTQWWRNDLSFWYIYWYVLCVYLLHFLVEDF